MGNEVITVQENNGAVATSENYKEIAIHWLESTGNLKKFNEQQKNQFIDICCAYGLNPIKKEVYGIPYGDKFNLIVGYESYIKRAERSGRLDGWGVEILGGGANMKAVITINRKDWDKPFKHEVYFEEYNTNQNLWKSKPRTMLKKVAIAQGFRMCFSEELGGMPYTKDELPEEMTTDTATVKVETSNNTSEEGTKKISPKKNKIAPNKQAETEKLYTPEQVQTLGNICTSTYPNGVEIFDKVEKDEFKTMLVHGAGDEAIKRAEVVKNQRLQDFEECREDTPEEDINAIANNVS